MTTKNSNRNTVLFESREFKNVKEFSAFIGKPYGYCLSRLNQGLSPEEVLSAPFRWNSAIQNLVVIEGKMYHSMKFATLSYTGVYDNTEYRKIRRSNSDLSPVQGLHKLCHIMLMSRLSAYKKCKHKWTDAIKDAAIRVNKQVNRLDRALTKRTSLLSSPIAYCRDCGVSLGNIVNRRTIRCSECIKKKEKEWKRNSLKPNRDHGKHIHRVRRTGADYTSGITAKSVAIRDCMICQICGITVEQHKGKGHQLKGWTIGHILAIAKGGSHTWDNVQCECIRCNVSKGLINDKAFKANMMPFNPKERERIVAFMNRPVSREAECSDAIIEQLDMFG